MYIVTIENNDLVTTIHGTTEKLTSGKIVKGINAIDSFTFTILPDNVGFGAINEFSTHVRAWNANKGRYDFQGRVLYASTSMDESGKIVKTVTCESLAGYLCDSWQSYVEERNWTVRELLEQLIACHNAQVEAYKHFKVGVITVTDANDNLYQGIQRENTWDAIKNKLLDKLGGELQIRVEEDGLYLDYLVSIGEEKETPIALSYNMKSIEREQDPTAYVTRLIPLGAKQVDENGEETEQRLTLKTDEYPYDYIDDEDAVDLYGVHVGVVEFDDITTVEMLRLRGEQWMAANNGVNVKYTVSALDLSLINKAVDDFDIGNTHPVRNALIGVNDMARIIKVGIDVCDETRSTIEVGDSLKSLSDIQREQAASMKGLQSSMATQGYVKNAMGETKAAVREDYMSEIEQLADSITLEVSGSLGSNASIILSAGANERSYELDLSQVREAFANENTAISISAGLITFNAGTLIVNSSKFMLDSDGAITATDATISGTLTTKSSRYMAKMDSGGLELYYDNILCGTINTKYWSGAATEGVSLRVEEGGNYIMFSHADDSQGSGYVVDYYLNAGWSSNYDEMHIFQTSARFLSDAYFAGKTRIRSLRLFDADGEYLVGVSGGKLTVSKL